MKNLKNIMKLQKQPHSIRFAVTDITGIYIRKKSKMNLWAGTIQDRHSTTSTPEHVLL